MKMDDKFGCVLRIETVINNPREFKVRRSGIRQGVEIVDWFPMGKGVANMPRYREICMAANRRYLDALAVVPDPGEPPHPPTTTRLDHQVNLGLK